MFYGLVGITHTSVLQLQRAIPRVRKLPSKHILRRFCTDGFSSNTAAFISSRTPDFRNAAMSWSMLLRPVHGNIAPIPTTLEQASDYHINWNHLIALLIHLAVSSFEALNPCTRCALGLGLFRTCRTQNGVCSNCISNVGWGQTSRQKCSHSPGIYPHLPMTSHQLRRTQITRVNT